MCYNESFVLVDIVFNISQLDTQLREDGLDDLFHIPHVIFEIRRTLHSDHSDVVMMFHDVEILFVQEFEFLEGLEVDVGLFALGIVDDPFEMDVDIRFDIQDTVGEDVSVFRGH